MSGLFFPGFEKAYCKFSRNETLFSRHETVVFRSRCNFASEIKKQNVWILNSSSLLPWPLV